MNGELFILLFTLAGAGLVYVFVKKQGDLYKSLLGRQLITTKDPAIVVSKQKVGLANGLLVAAEQSLLFAFSKTNSTNVPYADIEAAEFKIETSLDAVVGTTLLVKTKMGQQYQCMMTRPHTKFQAARAAGLVADAYISEGASNGSQLIQMNDRSNECLQILGTALARHGIVLRSSSAETPLPN